MYGNDKPVKTVTDEWTAAEDIGPFVLRGSTDRNGKLSSALKEVSRGDPDLALFRPPQDYETVDETGPFTLALPRFPSAHTGRPS